MALLVRPHVAIIVDGAVVATHLRTLTDGLDKAHITYDYFIVRDGEAAKSFAHLQILLDWLIEHRIDRHDVLIALGGGVVGDLCGFAAAILRRGMRFVQIPTTLLAQVDSSIGGKTGINVAQGKNLIGAFHHPALVLSDITTLATLSLRELRAGYAEIVKYAALGDIDFFGWLEAHGSAVLARKPQALTHAIRTGCMMKINIVERDAQEHDIRALLNLGHSFAHAIEAQCGYDGTVLHGEAVSFGMVLAFELSVAQNLCPPEDAARLTAHLDALGLATTLNTLLDDKYAAQITSTTMYQAMQQDKKIRGGRMQLILAHRIGDAFVMSIDPAILQKFLDAQFASNSTAIQSTL